MAIGFENLVLPRFRTEIRKNAFSDKLPDSLKQVETVKMFKNGPKNYIENGGRPGYE
jgi:hypothetical protein